MSKSSHAMRNVVKEDSEVTGIILAHASWVGKCYPMQRKSNTYGKDDPYCMKRFSAQRLQSTSSRYFVLFFFLDVCGQETFSTAVHHVKRKNIWGSYFTEIWYPSVYHSISGLLCNEKWDSWQILTCSWYLWWQLQLMNACHDQSLDMSKS